MREPAPENNLSLVPMDGNDFLLMLRRHGRSVECGPIASQYVDELSNGTEGFGAFALVTCEGTIGAISYGLHQEPRGGVSGRLDAVVVHPGIRKAGLGALMMAQLFDWFMTELGDELHHMSTVAVHPAVVRFVADLGFELGPGDIPRYRVDLEDPNQLRRLKAANDKQLRHRLRFLHNRCLTCQNKPWGRPWCEPAPLKVAG